MVNQYKIKQYCRTVSKQCPRAYRKKIRETVTLAVTEYTDTHPAADIQQFEQHFGTPQQFVEAFLGDLPAVEKQQYIRHSKTVAFCSIAAVIVFVAAVVTTAVIVIHDNREAAGAYTEVSIEQ